MAAQGLWFHVVDYTAKAASALALITKYGTELTFTTFAKGAYVPSTNKVSKTPSNYTAQCVKSTFTVQERADGAIKTGDVKLIASVSTYKVGDEVAINSDVYRIMDFRSVEPALIPVVYILQVRK